MTSANADEVLAEVRTMGPATVEEIARGTGLSRSTVRRHLSDLVLSGDVVSESYQRRSRVYMEADAAVDG
jgi:predicted ArsR family transcriptional regulator